MKIRERSLDERIRVGEDIWERIVEDQSRLPVSEAQNRQVDRRFEAYRLAKDPGEPAVDAIEQYEPIWDGSPAPGISNK